MSGIISDNQGRSSGLVKAAAAGGTTAPYFCAGRSADQSSLSDSTWTKFEGTNEILDSDGEYDNATNYRFTPQTSGNYYVSLGISFGSGDNQDLQQTKIAIYKNGSAIIQQIYDPAQQGTAYIHPQHLSGMVALNGTSDYIEAYVWIDTISGTRHIDHDTGSNHFSAFKMTE